MGSHIETGAPVYKTDTGLLIHVYIDEEIR